MSAGKQYAHNTYRLPEPGQRCTAAQRATYHAARAYGFWQGMNRAAAIGNASMGHMAAGFVASIELAMAWAILDGRMAFTATHALDESLTGGQVRQRALTAPENAGVIAGAKEAARRWVCTDCGDGIGKGSLYVLYTMMPGCEFNDGRKPYRVRYCLSCSDSTESRIALGVHAVKSFRRAEELAS